jgi:hypothetical protein
MLVDAERNRIVLGERFDATLDDIESISPTSGSSIIRRDVGNAVAFAPGERRAAPSVATELSRVHHLTPHPRGNTGGGRPTPDKDSLTQNGRRNLPSTP